LSDEYYGDFAASLQGIRNATKPFQLTPRLLECDHRHMQATFSGGLLVGMADGAVGQLSPHIPVSTLWALVTPAGGESLTDDF
jgi:hypothetical protein